MFFQSPSDLFRTDEFLDKTSQLPEEALIMTIDNKDANDQCFMFTSAKVKKISRWRPIDEVYTTTSLQPRCFF